VLSAGHFELTTNTSGLITQIDGRPAHPDPYRSYWAYFTDAGAGWRYNGLGPAGTHPAAGSVEGWNYEPADAREHVPPPAASYAQICAGRDRPAPPSPASNPPPSPASNPPAHPARAAGTAAAHRASSPASSPRSTRPAAAPAPARSRVGATPPATPTPDHRTAGARSPDGPVPAHPASGSAGPSVPATAPSPRLSPVSAGGGAGTSALPTVGTAAAILAVLALVGSGLWRARRRGRS
jgi:hypothetical protein